MPRHIYENTDTKSWANISVGFFQNTEHMLRHGLANATGNVLRIALAFVSIPILVHNLGLHDYGLLTLLIAVINLGALSEVGLTTSTTIHVAAALRLQKPDQLRDTIAFTLAVALVASFLAGTAIVLTAPVLSHWLFAARQKQYYTVIIALCLAALAVLARTVFQVFIGLLHAMQRFPTASALQTLWFYITQLSLLGISAFTHNLAIFGAAMAGAAILAAFAAWWHVRRDFNLPLPKWRAAPEIRRPVFQTTWDVGATNLATTLFNQGDKLIVGAILDPVQLGIYCTFTTIAAQINTLSAATCQPVLAHISRLGSDAKNLASSAFSTAFILCSVIATGLAAGIILSIPPLLRLLFPAVSSAHDPSLVILIWAYTLIALNAPAYFALQAMHETRLVRNVTLSSGIFSLLAIGSLAVPFGLVGACIGNFGFLIITVFIFKISRKLHLSKADLAAGLACLLAPMIATWAWWATFGYARRAFLLVAIAFGLGSVLFRLYRSHRGRTFPSS